MIYLKSLLILATMVVQGETEAVRPGKSKSLSFHHILFASLIFICLPVLQHLKFQCVIKLRNSEVQKQCVCVLVFV